VVIDRGQCKAGIGQHAFRSPQPKVEYSSRMWVTTAVAVEIVILDAEISPLFDIALCAIGAC